MAEVGLRVPSAWRVALRVHGQGCPWSQGWGAGREAEPHGALERALSAMRTEGLEGAARLARLRGALLGQLRGALLGQLRGALLGQLRGAALMGLRG